MTDWQQEFRERVSDIRERRGGDVAESGEHRPPVILDHPQSVIDADGQCVLVHETYGRCPGNCLHEHHLLLRSALGHEGPKIPICIAQHDQFHPGPGASVRLVPVMTDGAGLEIEMTWQEKLGLWVPDSKFATKVDGLARQDVVWRVRQYGGRFHGAWWDLWLYDHVRDNWEGRGARMWDGLTAGLQVFERSPWIPAWHLYEIAEGYLWSYLGIGIEPTLEELLEDKYAPLNQLAALLDYSPATLRNWLRAETHRRQLPPEEAEMARLGPIRLLRDAGTELLARPEPERKALIQAVATDHERTAPVIEGLKEGRAVEQAAKAGQARFEIDADLRVRVSGRVTAPTAHEAERRLRAMILHSRYLDAETAEFSDIVTREVSE